MSHGHSLCSMLLGKATVNSRVALLVAIPIIVVAVLVLTFLGFFSSTGVIAVLVVLYAVVSLANRRKFAKQNREERQK